MPSLGYLLYSSTAVRKMESEDLTNLLEISRANNKRRGITGMLLYKDGCFMQMLEGDQDEVRNLFETIRQDSRHESVVEIVSDPVQERSFSDWSMGFVDMDQVIPGAPDFEEYFYRNFSLRQFSSDAHAATLFIRSFKQLSKVLSLMGDPCSKTQN